MDSEEIRFKDLEMEQTEFLDASAAASAMQRRLAKPQGFAALKRLDEEAQARGYRAATGPSAEFGLRYRVRSRVPIRPPEGEEGAPVQDVHFELTVRALEKPDSEDQAAIATAMVTAGQHSEEQDIFLEARGGNFARAREFKVEGDRVIPTNSWWTAARDCVLHRCGSVCVGSLVSCSGTWAAYLACVAVACGGCWVTCAACATCNCRWWCRWAPGCCHQ
jgi:hypothetical protein